MTRSLLACLSFAVFAGTSLAQPFQDGGFEAQALGTIFTSPWSEGGGTASAIVNSPPAGLPATGFPTEGTQWAVIDPSNIGPYTAGCAAAPGATAAFVSQTFGICESVGIVSFDWNFFNAEGPNQTNYNDFLDVAIFEAATSTRLVTLVYVDTWDGTTGLPACTPAGGLAYPISFGAGGEVQPTGFKTAYVDMVTVPGYTPGMPLMLIATCANRGDSAVASRGFIDNIQIQSSSLPNAGQANSAAAHLEVNGAGAGACQGPFNVTLGAAATLTFAWQGPAGMPIAIVAGPQNPGGASFPCIGIADVGTPPLYADITLLFSGTVPGFPNNLFFLNGAGTALQAFTLPSLPPGPLINLQGIVFQPVGAPCPAVLTAAFYIGV